MLDQGSQRIKDWKSIFYSKGDWRGREVHQNMIYAALSSVVADIRRRRWRSMLPFLAQEFVAHSETFEDKENWEGVAVQLNDMEALTMVTFAYSCLASLLIAIVLVRILLAHHSVNFFRY